ncbi:hypothetical protein LG324_03365 [Phycicoccus jejuensis]|uniref:DUF3644 domain-containing protein n=1 Tax=Phycicoccus jejuensis TaxID=367299 RepID=UPI00384DE900
MKREVRLLKDKAVASLTLSVEHFNRPWDLGRGDAVLILLDHAFEMLLKASILHRGGRIREPREKNTIGFDACVRRALSTPGVQFLTDEQALVLQAINGLRDAAQHHLVDLSEAQLYLHAQGGVTLFRDVVDAVFQEKLSDLLPARVLPISTRAITDPMLMFEEELEEVRQLLAPGSRRQAEAQAKLRGLAIVDGAIRGELLQPGEGDLRQLVKKVRSGHEFGQIFQGIASVTFVTDGSGPNVSLRIAKNEGVPITIVPEGTPGSSVIAVRRVDELGFYNLGHNDLAKKVGLTPNKTSAAIRLLNLKSDPDCYKEFKIGAVRHQRYSQNAIGRIRALLAEKGVDAIWQEYRRIQQEAKLRS